MRRLWAHILLAAAALVIMGSTLPSIFTRTQSNAEYSDSREIVYRLTDKENPEEEITTDEGVKTIAKQMAERLDTVGITAYKISTSGNDFIKVNFAENNSVSKSNIINFLSFNGSLGLSNMDDDENYEAITGDQFLLEGKKTYLDNINGYPTVVIPINKDSEDFKNLIEKTTTQHENGVGEEEETGETDENGSAKTEIVTYLYLWYDFDITTDSYSRTVEGNEGYDVNIANKIIMKFNVESPYFPDDNNDKLAASLKVDQDGDGSASYSEITNAYNNARFYVNLLNSGELAYDVTFVNQSSTNMVDPWIERIIVNADPYQYIAWNRTLIATICATVIIALIFVVFFRLHALAVGVCTLGATYSAIGFMVALGAEFNVASLIGIIIIAVAALASGVVYCCKFKFECYKGRSIKKANTEASKKALLCTVDIHVVIMILGAFTYLFGGAYMRTFGFICTIGGIVSLLINILALKGLTWLSTNTTGLTGKYEVFGVDSKKVPNLLNNEKQEYIGPFGNKDFTKKRKPVGIVAAVLFVASLAGLITFGCLNNGDPYNHSTTATVSELYIYTPTEGSLLTNSDYVSANILSQIKVLDQNKTLDTYVGKEDNYYFTKTEEGVEVTTNFKVYQLKSVLNGDVQAEYVVTGQVDSLNELFKYVVTGFDINATINLKQTSQAKQSVVNNNGILIAAAVTVAVCGVYFALRYKLSRAIPGIIIPAVTVGITAGFFALIRAALPTSIPVMIPFVLAFTLIISIFFMNREKELQLEDRNYKTLTLEEKDAYMHKASTISFMPIFIFTIIVAYLAINFFGIGPTGTSLTFIAALLGVLVGAVLVVNWYGYIAQFFAGKFHNIAANRKPRKKVKKVAPRSSEPEEAIFIGIND